MHQSVRATWQWDQWIFALGPIVYAYKSEVGSGAVQLQQLRYVIAVAEEHGFTQAAARLQVSQPSVSSSVRALERELGIELFRRSGRDVVASAAGEALLPWARQAIADCEAGRSAVGNLLGLRGGTLSLGATPSLTTGVVAKALVAFHQRYPGVVLSVHEDGSQNLVSALERGALDLAVVILPINRSWVHTEALADEDLVLAVSEGHPMHGRASVAVADLEDLPLVMFRQGYDLREATVAVCRAAGFAPTFSVEGLEMDGVLALTGGGLGAAVVPSTVVSASSGLGTVPFSDGALRRTVGLASRHNRTTPASRAFGDTLRAVLAS